MTKDVVIGHPDWSLEQVAAVMGNHQVRRLPIVHDGSVVGIVSLGDVALHTPKRDTVAQSLRNISEQTRSRIRGASPYAKILAVAVPVSIAVGVVLFSRTKPGQQVRRQIEASQLPDKARALWTESLQSLADPHTREAALQAWESTGIPEKARQVANDAAGFVRHSDPRERALEFAEAANNQARQLPNYIAQAMPQPQKRRFWII